MSYEDVFTNVGDIKCFAPNKNAKDLYNKKHKYYRIDKKKKKIKMYKTNESNRFL